MIPGLRRGHMMLVVDEQERADDIAKLIDHEIRNLELTLKASLNVRAMHNRGQSWYVLLEINELLPISFGEILTGINAIANRYRHPTRS